MTKKPKIWVVSEYYYPTHISTGYYITEISEHLAKNGLNIGVICTDSNYKSKHNHTLKKIELRNGVQIHRIKTGSTNKNNFLLRGINLVWSSLLLLIKIYKNVKKDDKILVVTNPVFLFLFLPIIKRIKKINFTILVHDIFPENLSAIGKMNKNSVIYKFLKSIFDNAYSKSEACIVIGRDMQEVIRLKTKNKIKTHLIPNWSDIEDVFPIEKNNTDLVAKQKLKEKFIFQFAGNLGQAQGLDNILKSISLIENDSLHFLFIGTGAKEQSIKKFIDSHTLKNISLVGFQDRNKQNDFLNACDVSIVTLNEGMYGLGVPSKSYNILAAGKPIIIVAHEKSEISLCIKEHKIGWVVEPNNPEALKETFLLAYKNANHFQEVCKKSRKVAEMHFAKNVILNKYLELFKN